MLYRFKNYNHFIYQKYAEQWLTLYTMSTPNWHEAPASLSSQFFTSGSGSDHSRSQRTPDQYQLNNDENDLFIHYSVNNRVQVFITLFTKWKNLLGSSLYEYMFRFEVAWKLLLDFLVIPYPCLVHRSVVASDEFVPNYGDQVRDLQTIKK